MKRKLSISFAGVLLALTFSVSPANSQVEDFFEKNVITLIVPYGAGGGVDFAARLVASYWTDVTGGSMVVKNKTGGGGLVGTNFAYNAKPDGKTIGTGILGATILAPALLKEPGVQFDVQKFNWIGLIVPGSFGLGVSARKPYKTVADLQKARGITFASTGAKDLTTLGAALTIDLLGLKDAKIIAGYRGGSAAALSVAKGETDAYVIQDDALYASVEKGFVKSSMVTLNFSRSEWFPETPTITDATDLSPEQDRLLRVFASFNAGKVFFAPPGISEEKLQFFREAFNKIVSSKGFLRQAKLKWPIWEKPLMSQEIDKEIEKVDGFSTEDMSLFRDTIEKHLK